MKQLLLFNILFSFLNISAQNLVLNPSFEGHKDDRCIINLGGFNRNVSNWSIPNFGSTDFFDTCSDAMGIKNYNGYQEPKSGNSYVGIYVYTDKNYREYIQGELKETLLKGETYQMKFYLSLADKSSFGLCDIEVLFTEEKLKPCYNSNKCEKNIKPKSTTDKEFKTYSDGTENYYLDKKNWQEYTITFVASGYENYFSIGNFYRNKKTKKQQTLSKSPYKFSYYYIDDVSLVSLKNSKISEGKLNPREKEILTVKEERPDIEINKTYQLKNVLFNFDKSELLEVSKEELKILYQYLKENKQLKIEIYGHTDDVGLSTRNQELSTQRAKAVADYLILLGINTTRISSFGFGSSDPITTNETEEERQKNRRVEFKLINN